MFTKSWQVLKDDDRKTFEVCGQERNTNHFTNQVHAMQRTGMNVSYAILPVTNRNASRDAISIQDYVREQGLEERLLKEHRRRLMSSVDPFDDADEE